MFHLTNIFGWFDHWLGSLSCVHNILAVHGFKHEDSASLHFEVCI
jgi:hypothetical protein